MRKNYSPFLRFFYETYSESEGKSRSRNSKRRKKLLFSLLKRRLRMNTSVEDISKITFGETLVKLTYTSN